jgi:hypothetical protein
MMISRTTDDVFEEEMTDDEEVASVAVKRICEFRAAAASSLLVSLHKMNLSGFLHKHT